MFYSYKETGQCKILEVCFTSFKKIRDIQRVLLFLQPPNGQNAVCWEFILPCQPSPRTSFCITLQLLMMGSRRGDVFTARGCEVVFVLGPSKGIAQSYKRDTDPFQIQTNKREPSKGAESQTVQLDQFTYGLCSSFYQNKPLQCCTKNKLVSFYFSYLVCKGKHEYHRQSLFHLTV